MYWDVVLDAVRLKITELTLTFHFIPVLFLYPLVLYLLSLYSRNRCNLSIKSLITLPLSHIY